MAAEDGCDTLSCEGLEAGDQIPDPYNCNSYYVCLSNCHVTDVPLDCDEGLIFDSVSKECKEPNEANCTLCPPKCASFSCGGNGTYLAANPENCTHYQICGLGSEPISVECPSGEYFDGVACQPDPNKCCDICIVFCEFAFTEVADPTDCHRFYYCPSGQYYPEEEDLKTCPAGKVFSSKLGMCAESEPCVQPCAGSRRKTKPPKPSFTTCDKNAAPPAF
ncbi:peritrophin-48-like [Panulirus ornatus]|uniref:peritrophin-48-like n=1 Tax=Panulirus ornatus TaxID=150431 RepID=UPI003A86CA0A